MASVNGAEPMQGVSLSGNSFSDFMKCLIALLHKNGVPMPLKDERLWHTLFYRLKVGNLGFAEPSCLASLRFDWDGDYPRCREVSEFLHALQRSVGLSVTNRCCIVLPDELARLWENRIESLDSDARQILEDIVLLAQDEFSLFARDRGCVRRV